MEENRNDRAAWLMQHIIPVENSLRKWLSRFANTGLDIGDIVQETYAILASLKSVSEIQNPKAYAFKTAHSVILAYLRRTQVVSITSVSDMDSLVTIASEPSPEDLLRDREELRNVLQAVAALPPRVRKILILRRLNGLSQREVAQRLGISENIVAKSMVKGVQATQAALGDVKKSGMKSHLNTLDSKGRAKNLFLVGVKGKKSPL